MAGQPRHDPDFRREVARCFRQALEEQRLSAAAAAKQLGVSRQAFYNYLNGTMTPNGHVLAAAVIHWDLKIKYKSQLFGIAAFQPADDATEPKSSPEQLHLFSEPREIDEPDNGVSLKISPRGTDAIDIRLRLKLTS